MALGKEVVSQTLIIHNLVIEMDNCTSKVKGYDSLNNIVNSLDTPSSHSLRNRWLNDVSSFVSVSLPFKENETQDKLSPLSHC